MPGKIIKKKIIKVKQKVTTESEPNTTDTEINDDRLVTVKYGKPLFDIKFRTIKIITFITLILLICNILFALKLFYNSVKIRNHLGYFINMVSAGDGTKLPIFQSIPPLIFLFINFFFIYILFKLFNRNPQSKFNGFLFITIIIDVVVIFATFIVLFVIMGHIYGSHTAIHDGIVEAMKSYSSNSLMKKQIDRLQIEFQCCGSKKYDEWYSILWYNPSLIKQSKPKKRKADIAQKTTDFVCESCQLDQSDSNIEEEENTNKKPAKGQILNKANKGDREITDRSTTKDLKNSGSNTPVIPIDSSKGNTPFSCCSITSLFPCIHHNIEITGKAYLYTPEQNLSISVDGCHDKLKQKTIQVGWTVIGNLVLCTVLQIALLIGLRFLQTAHFARSKFEGHSRLYTVWLFGRGTIKKNRAKNEAPPIPPVPEDLMT